MARLAHRGVAILQGVQVLGIFPENRLLVNRADGRVLEMAARCIVCASGARERFIPFPGWTLPGVIAAGAAQILLKTSGMLPAATTLVGGTGPLPLLLARQLVAHGGRVKALLNHSPPPAVSHALRMLPRHAGKLAEGAWLTASLALAGVPIHFNRRIVEATGRGRLEAVTVARVDRQGGVVRGSLEKIQADGLAVGFGFTPNIELLQQAGCEAVYRADRGGWVVRTDRRLETSVADLFAAGEVTGIAGGVKSFIEGRLCGLSILDRLGMAAKAAASAAERRRLLRQRDHELTFGALVNRLCRVPAHWVAAIPDDTLICRCEDVRMGDLRQRLGQGFDTPGALKKATRCGMGICQGRICGGIVADILDALAADQALYRRQSPSIRSPVKPVLLGALAAMERLHPENPLQ
jgi:NADPH-dependent 2,4-dienoyl-CoA reductase/sulfur reductase-like enzyme